MKFPKKFVPFLFIPILAACGASPQAQTPQAAAAIVPAAVVSDGTYQAVMGGQTATLTIRGGQPVSYNWGTYEANRVSIRGSVIRIDQATLTVTESNESQFSGRWSLGGTRLNVTFQKG